MAVAEAALAGGMAPDALYLDVLAGAMVDIGDGWHTGDISVAEEHQATAIMHRLLGRLARNFTRRGRRRGTIVLGAAAGDPHGLPGALLADPLRGRGFAVIDLGPDTPADAFVDAATHADGLVALGMTLSLPPTAGPPSTSSPHRPTDFSRLRVDVRLSTK
jgi:methanogenic corrinoid protein MtbC1